jgi:hypothetical protein
MDPVCLVHNHRISSYRYKIMFMRKSHNGTQSVLSSVLGLSARPALRFSRPYSRFRTPFLARNRVVAQLLTVVRGPRVMIFDPDNHVSLAYEEIHFRAANNSSTWNLHQFF